MKAMDNNLIDNIKFNYMIKHASWTHGNLIVIENTENIEVLRHYGWGTKIGVVPLQGSWFHISIPTPVILKDKRAKVQKLFLLFRCPGDYPSSIREVHIWDAATLVQKFEGLDLKGDYGGHIDASNTFTLTNPHEVLFGMSISFYFQGGNRSPGSERINFTVTGAGADFF
jgi:Family of unknown function (DUF6623)